MAKLSVWNSEKQAYELVDDDAAFESVMMEIARQKNAQQSAQSDGATCSAYYHMHLAQKGETRCGICGSPLSR